MWKLRNLYCNWGTFNCHAIDDRRVRERNGQFSPLETRGDFRPNIFWGSMDGNIIEFNAVPQIYVDMWDDVYLMMYIRGYPNQHYSI